jgi:hypothetical protein
MGVPGEKAVSPLPTMQTLAQCPCPSANRNAATFHTTHFSSLVVKNVRLSNIHPPETTSRAPHALRAQQPNPTGAHTPPPPRLMCVQTANVTTPFTHISASLSLPSPPYVYPQPSPASLLLCAIPFCQIELIKTTGAAGPTGRARRCFAEVHARAQAQGRIAGHLAGRGARAAAHEERAREGGANNHSPGG